MITFFLHEFTVIKSLIKLHNEVLKKQSKQNKEKFIKILILR